VGKLANNTLGTQARIDGLIEIDDLTEELIKYERILDDIDSFKVPGVGSVAAKRNAGTQKAAKKRGFPDPPDEAHYYVDNPDGEIPFRLIGGKYEVIESSRLADGQYDVVVKNGLYAIITKKKATKTWAVRKLDLGQKYLQPGSFTKLENALNQRGLTNEDKGVIRRLARGIEELEKKTGDENLVNELVSELSPNFGETKYDNFRRQLRDKTANFIAEQTPEQRQQILQQFLNLQPDSNSKGYLFTAFRQKTQGRNFEQVLDRDLRLDNPNLDGVKIADDAVVVKNDIEEGPPAGKYLVDDKAGPNAFDKTQAENYSSSIEQGGGIIKTMGGKEYDGLIYFFDTRTSAEKAMGTINNLNHKIYVGYYNPKGELEWLLRSTVR
jgi:hypothetical protein